MKGERRLERPLLEWLRRSRRVREDTLVVRELPWHGRRVDLATLTRSGRTTSYELKLNGMLRALQQANYNRVAFDRSYVVTAAEPGEANRCRAREAGVGVIVVRKDGCLHIVEEPSRESPTRPIVRRRLVGAIRTRGTQHV